VLAGRDDLPIDGAAVLFAHQHIDNQQYSMLGEVTRWLHLAARAWGQKDGSCGGLWTALLAVASRTANTVIPVPAGADAARYRLAKTLRQLDGSRVLVCELAEGRIPPLVIRTVNHCLTAQDEAELTQLRDGLDRIAGRR
jgi:hypothetical protein